MIKGWHVATIVVVMGILALFYVGLGLDPRAIPSVLVGTTAPTFAGPDVQTGETISLDAYKGKVVVLNFWASWCQECRLEHQNLLAIHNRFRNDPNFVMLGIDYQDKVEDAVGFLNAFGSTYSHVRDIKGAIAIDFGVYGVPETFVIDPQGVIRFKYVGPIVGPAYSKITDQIIQPLLQKKGVPQTS
ncbi:MAG: redoxin domain-containing protein [Nitrospirae bacterium]|nr:redoxin domain-containing protein [Nitrospirota bacterium]